MRLNSQLDYYSELYKLTEGNVGYSPDEFIFDSEIHRFGEKDICWYVGDEYTVSESTVIYVTVGNWRDGTKFSWNNISSDISKRQFTKSDLADIKNKKNERIAKALEAKKTLHEEARLKAVSMWQLANKANLNHPYLVSKNIAVGCVRQFGDLLYVPLTDADGCLHNIQTITPSGIKRFLSGGRKKGLFCVVGGNIESTDEIFIAEGFSTASSVCAYFEKTTVCAFDAGNLKPVSQALRARHPLKPIVIAADNDSSKLTNTGLNSAKKVQSEVSNVSIVFPEFPLNAPNELSDFNDLINYLAKEGM